MNFFNLISQINFHIVSNCELLYILRFNLFAFQYIWFTHCHKHLFSHNHFCSSLFTSTAAVAASSPIASPPAAQRSTVHQQRLAPAPQRQRSDAVHENSQTQHRISLLHTPRAASMAASEWAPSMGSEPPDVDIDEEHDVDELNRRERSHLESVLAETTAAANAASSTVDHLKRRLFGTLTLRYARLMLLMTSFTLLNCTLERFLELLDWIYQVFGWLLLKILYITDLISSLRSVLFLIVHFHFGCCLIDY